MSIVAAANSVTAKVSCAKSEKAGREILTVSDTDRANVRLKQSAPSLSDVLLGLVCLPLCIGGCSSANEPVEAKSYDQLGQAERIQVNTIVFKAANRMFGISKDDMGLDHFRMDPETETLCEKPYAWLVLLVNEPIGMPDMTKADELKNMLNGATINYSSDGTSKSLQIKDSVVQIMDFAARREKDENGAEKFIPSHREYRVYVKSVSIK